MEKIKILHLSSEKAWRGGEQQIAFLIDALSKLGVESFLGVRKNSELANHCRKTNTPYFPLPFSSSFDFVSAVRVTKICRKHGISIVHIHNSKSQSIAMLSASFGNNVPCVVSRKVDFIPGQNFLTRWKYNHPAIKRIVCVSDKIKSTMSAFLGSPEKCVTIHDGVDLGKFASSKTNNLLREQFKVSDNYKLIGNTSALDKHKDYYTYINVIEILLQRKLPVKAFIIGTGKLEPELKKYVLEKKLENDILFTGFLNNINEILPELSLFLMTSRIEGLGSSILDAFLAGVPVVSTDAGGIPEIVIHGKTGMLAPIGDFKMLADHVENILTNDNFRRELVDQAKKKVTEFSKEITALKTLEVYKEVLSEN